MRSPLHPATAAGPPAQLAAPAGAPGTAGTHAPRPVSLTAPELGIEPTAAGPGAPMLLEVSWEVCNQLGGIFQVLRSKAPRMVEAWGDRYCCIGPWNPQAAALEFEETPLHGHIGQAVASLRAEGLNVRHGRWMISGRPRALLIEHWQGTERLDAAKFRIWNDHRIPSPAGDALLDGVISFGDAVRRVVERVVSAAGDEHRVVAHMHEYMGAMAMPMLRHSRVPVALVFTTHATLLGRYMASNEEDFYERLGWGTINDEHESEKYRVRTQHLMERACAHSAHVLTTVSSITGEECSGLLGRACDVVLPNGLDIQRYNVGHEFQGLHAKYKEKIHRFVMGHFFPSYSFDLSSTLYFFTSGRYEPRNKGFDLSLEAMARLNAELRAANLGITVVFFIITKRATQSLHPWALQQRGVLNEFNWVCDQIMSHVGEKLFKQGATGARVDLDKSVDEYWVLRYRRVQQALKVDRLPLVTTHMIEGGDPVLDQVRSLGLINRAEDPVKVVYHPDFINATNPLWGMDYEQFVRGCHAGVFPSAYEPWGYTPLECLAMGVPAVSSDLAGFGAYTLEMNQAHARPGMWVVRRRGRGYHDAAAELTRYLMDYCRLDRRGRIGLRNQVEAQAWAYDWSVLGTAYDRAHEMALERAFGSSARVGAPGRVRA